jgi:hypothetical protein
MLKDGGGIQTNKQQQGRVAAALFLMYACQLAGLAAALFLMYACQLAGLAAALFLMYACQLAGLTAAFFVFCTSHVFIRNAYGGYLVI